MKLHEQQNLLVRTAELYFGVLRAIDNLNASISEEKAIKKQLDQAKYLTQGTASSLCTRQHQDPSSERPETNVIDQENHN